MTLGSVSGAPIAALFLASHEPIDYYGPPPRPFASKGEEAVYWELKKRQVPFVYQWIPGERGDLPFTPGRDEISFDFTIVPLRMVLEVNDPFTHADPLVEAEKAHMVELIGFQRYAVWTADIVAEEGGNVREALDRIPGLGFIGQASYRAPAGYRKLRRYGQPPRNVSFRAS